MNDSEFINAIAREWLRLGGDSEGVAWSWKRLQEAVQGLESRPTKDAPDVAYCAECEWKLGSDGECINGCVQPIATQVI